MLTLEVAGNTTRINVVSPMIDISLRTQLLQSLLILNLAIMKLESFTEDYYRVFSISKDKDLELHLKRQPNFCFVICNL